MKTIRKGSDIVVRWRIFRYGQKYDIALYRESISLVLSNMGEKKEITDYSIVDVNTIVFKYRAEDQGLGIYRLLLIDKSRNSTRIIEECNAFRLVNTSDAANNDGTLESAITITLTSELTAPADGLSAYEVALQNGFIGTEEEWLQSLVPDTTDIELAEAQRQAKELERIEAENTRQSAELERQQATTEAISSTNAAATNANNAATGANNAASTAQQKAEEATAAAGSANAIVDEFKSIIVQETGNSQVKVMSQKAVTDAMTASQAKLSELEDRIVNYIGSTSNPVEIEGTKVGDVFTRTTDGKLRKIVVLQGNYYESIDFVETEFTVFVYNGRKGQIINGEFQPYLLEEELVPVKDNLSVLLNETIEYKETNLPHIYVYNRAIANAVLFGDIDSYIVGSGASRIFRIDVSNIISVTYPVFKSSINYGNAFTDSEGKVLRFISETTSPTGTYKTIEVPRGAKYFFVDITESIVSALPDWMITCNKIGLPQKIDKINSTLFPIVKEDPFIAKGDVGSIIEFGSNAELSHIYVTNNCEVEASSGRYTMSSFVRFVNYNNVITRTMGQGLSPQKKHSFLIELQADEKGAYISGIANSISVKSYDGIVKDTYFLKNEVAKLTDKKVYTNDEDNNLVLCAIKTAILNSKIPFHAGYLFHKWSGNELYYGEDYGHIYTIGEAGFSPADKVMAMSPNDGTVIATFANKRGSLYVFDGKNTTELFANSSLKPMGWLYNSGVDFVLGNDGIERCIFAEYTNWPEKYATSEGYNVWVGKYPYTQESDWKVVFNQKYGTNPATDITHFHQVRRDPWTDILYLTSGDDSELSKWWYSTDKGETWVKLTDGVSSGWENSICRCINFIFTKDNIYFATDNNENHCLNKISRGSNGVIDISSRVKICDLNNKTATNSICYVENPNGIFFFDRQSEHNTEFSDELDVMFYSLTENKLVKLLSLHYVTPQWGGHRGKCYTNYMNSVETMPAMGFALDSKCIFDMISKDYANIGTIAYDICGTWSKVKSIVVE